MCGEHNQTPVDLMQTPKALVTDTKYCETKTAWDPPNKAFMMPFREADLGFLLQWTWNHNDVRNNVWIGVHYCKINPPDEVKRICFMMMNDLWTCYFAPTTSFHSVLVCVETTKEALFSLYEVRDKFQSVSSLYFWSMAWSSLINFTQLGSCSKWIQKLLFSVSIVNVEW